ncbi:MAG: hypothetical protein OXM01_04585 [Gemmatimonadota bacterium]|nr:hypothetical protein [Gemmatimonadota bacterium]
MTTGRHAALGRLRLATVAYTVTQIAANRGSLIDGEYPDCDRRLADQLDALWDAHNAGCTLADLAKAMQEPVSVTNRLLHYMTQERT